MAPSSASAHDDSKVELEKNSTSTSLDKVEAGVGNYGPKFSEWRTLAKIDFRILSVLGILYSFALIDRINLGSAFQAGMGVDLELTVGSRFSLVTCLYFVPYILLQLPGNLILRKIGARNWLTFQAVGFGVVLIGMGFVKKWEQLLVTRILLGVFEAAFFPGILWIITAWYRRYEVQKRIAGFSLVSVVCGALAPMLSYGLSLLEGRGGIRGWRWIFIVEGIITVGLAIVLFLFVPPFPEENTFLSPEETQYVIDKINADRGDALPDEITKEKVFRHLKDWTLWAYGCLFMCAGMTNYAQSYFLPIIFGGMGYDTKGALFRTAAPYGPALVSTMAVAYFSDKTRQRAAFIAPLVVICVMGNCLTAWHKNNSVRFLGCFFTVASNSASVPTILAYASNNVATHSKRMVQTSVLVAFGSIGGILAATVFRGQDRPKYIPGLIATILSQGIILVLLAVLTARHMYWNKQSREGKLSEPLEGHPGFLYTL